MSSPAKTLLDVSFGDNVKEDDDEEQDEVRLVEVVDAVDGVCKLAASGIPASCVSRKSPLELFFSFFLSARGKTVFDSTILLSSFSESSSRDPGLRLELIGLREDHRGS